MKWKRLIMKLLLNYQSGILRSQLLLPLGLCLLIAFALLCYNYTTKYSVVVSNSNQSILEKPLVVLVVNPRDAFERRERIRNTWASNYKHVYFVVSEQYCPHPPANRINGTCNSDKQPALSKQVRTYIDQEEEITEKLRNEPNVVLLATKDVFEELPNLIKLSYKWALQIRAAKWFLHVDVSLNVQVDTYQQYLAKNFEGNENAIMMLLMNCVSSLRDHKYLTPFHCTLNHVVSRHVAEYLVDSLDSLFEYKNTENTTSMQVLDSSNINSVHREDCELMPINDGCHDTGAIVLDICIERKMNMCVDGIIYTMSENPSDYLHSDRFDLIPKMVYAYFYIYVQHVPDIIRDAYLEHIRVWNNYNEICHMKKTWFDYKNACKMKKSSFDFISSFHKTITNVMVNGFNPNISRIPVDKNGFINNGAHRLSSSVVLAEKASFEHHKYKQNEGWGYKYFRRRGLSDRTIELVLLEWMKIQLKLPGINTSVYIVSVFSNDESKDEKMRMIVKEQCSKDNGIIYEKSMSITLEGAKQLMTHMYGQQSWLEAKLQAVHSRFTQSTLSVLFMFVYTKKNTDLVKCKDEVRKLYDDRIYKSTAHIPDTLEENLILAQMILNSNSIQFLNYAANARDCMIIAKEVASRSSTDPIRTLPGIYLGREDVMVDSGAVLGFYDLRVRTDVDLLFLKEIDSSILGPKDGITLQAHAFKYNSISKERAWGEDHFSETGTKDQWSLFYDPQNYGYCYGIKFVSLKQLVKYKMQRNELKKDAYDVSLINSFLKMTSSSGSPSSKCPNFYNSSLLLSIFFVICILCVY